MPNGGQFTVSTTGVDVLPANPFRKSIAFQHNGTANKIYIDTTSGVSISTGSAQLVMGASGTLFFNINDDGVETVTSQWSAIADSGSQTLLVRETVSKFPVTDKGILVPK